MELFKPGSKTYFRTQDERLMKITRLNGNYIAACKIIQYFI
jgi:hypothetical protein